MIFDTHAHYDDKAFECDREALLDALENRGVGLVLNPGCDARSSRAALDLAERFPFVYAAVGIHPEELGELSSCMTARPMRTHWRSSGVFRR